MTSIAAIVPARYGSTRLPGKPLLRDTGRTLIQHVYERIREARRVSHVIVATDDRRIADAVESFGGEVAMTSPEHQSGTDRVAEVARELDVTGVINVQGDEPDVSPDDLDRLADAIAAPDAEIATLAIPIDDAATFASPHDVKVVVDHDGNALYFSRAPIPWSDDNATPTPYGLRHLGVYAFTRAALDRFASLPPVELERRERLEQLRALHHGMRIRVLETAHDSIGIDTEDDYRRFVDRWRSSTSKTQP